MWLLVKLKDEWNFRGCVCCCRMKAGVFGLVPSVLLFSFPTLVKDDLRRPFINIFPLLPSPRTWPIALAGRAVLIV